MPLPPVTADTKPPSTITGSLFGVALTLEAADADLLSDMVALLPPQWSERPGAVPAAGARMLREPDGALTLVIEGQSATTGERDELLIIFERELRVYVASRSTGYTFIHAGAVAYDGTGLILPGASFAGKTTLVAALVRAGAHYYSDEDAVLGEDGRLYPYPKPLALRLTEGSPIQTPTAVSAIGGETGLEPVPVGLVAIAHYRPGASWEPITLSRAEGVIAVQEFASWRSRKPAQTLAAARQATAGAAVLRGERGDAVAVADDLLARLTAAAHPST